MSQMKIYASDPLAQLITLLWAGGQPSPELLERVCYEHYHSEPSLIAKAFNAAAGIITKITRRLEP